MEDYESLDCIVLILYKGFFSLHIFRFPLPGLRDDPGIPEHIVTHTFLPHG